ncbi:MAG: hypothetical protein ACF8R9_08375 [Phycisphaerales bacterium JB054]
MARRTTSITLTAAFLLAAAGTFPGGALGQTQKRGRGVLSVTPEVARQSDANKDDGGDGYSRGSSEGGSYSTVYDGDMLRLVSDSSGEVLIEQRARDFAKARVDGALSPEVDVEITSQGYSIHYSFTNDTSSAKPLPDLRVGPILLDERVTYQDVRHSCEDVQTEADSHRTPGHNYPINMYAPVWIVRDTEHAAGVSLEYPIMDYKHDVRFYLKYHPGSGGWLVDIRLSTETEALQYSASVPAGQTWEYTVNVRFDERSDEWVRTLLPYRDYFRENYGGLQYTREVTPVNAIGLSLGEAISNENPYGFSREDLRPDVHGYGPFVEFALDRKGWPEEMIVTPTGVLRRNVHLNYPFRFTSQWLANDNFETALDPQIGFPRIVNEGRKLGFWWGRSAQVSYAWDDGVGEELDPSYSRHRNEAFKELDLAIQAGATTIGLDTFGYRAIPTWEASPWLDTMRQRYPGVKFVLEPMPADIMHRQAAGWLRGFNDGDPVDSLEELNFIKGPHILADFLLPGHETWAAWRYKGHRKYLDITPTQEMVDDDVERFAQWGYRPMFYTDFDLTVPGRAAESWNYTIPDDIRLPPDGINTDFALDMGGGGDSNGPSGGNSSSGQGVKVGAKRVTRSGALASGIAGRSGSRKTPVVGVSAKEAAEALARAKQHLKPTKSDD